MFQDILLMPDPVFHKPLIIYGGMLIFLMLSTTAIIGWVTIKGIYMIPVKWHVFMARSTIALGLIHGLLGMLLYF